MHHHSQHYRVACGSHFETETPDPYPDAVTSTLWPGIALRILGWETEPDDDTDWSGSHTSGRPGLELRSGTTPKRGTHAIF
jgi:hypothetical protein